MKRLKYPIIIPINKTAYNQIDLELPADLECGILGETSEGDFVVKVKYIGFIVTTFLKKENIYEAH